MYKIDVTEKQKMYGKLPDVSLAFHLLLEADSSQVNLKHWMSRFALFREGSDDEIQ